MVHAYLSGPIIHTDLRKDDFYQLVVDVLKKKGITVFAPQFLARASPEIIYERDVEQVRKSDFVIAEVSYPSHGVGMEIMLGIELEKPLILFRHTNANSLSFMVKGAPGTVILEYNELKEVRETLQNHNFENLFLHQCHNCQSHIAEIVKDGFRCFGCGKDMKKPV
ncbi:MAG: nucleoside 2-deoxyribosyltransferase [Candidatus Thorarchaeota archaeon]